MLSRAQRAMSLKLGQPGSVRFDHLRISSLRGEIARAGLCFDSLGKTVRFGVRRGQRSERHRLPALRQFDGLCSKAYGFPSVAYRIIGGRCQHPGNIVEGSHVVRVDAQRLSPLFDRFRHVILSDECIAQIVMRLAKIRIESDRVFELRDRLRNAFLLHQRKP